MLIEEYVEIKVSKRNIEHYISMGYTDIERGEKVIVNSYHLTRGSEMPVKVKCDYCGVIMPRLYYDYISRRDKIEIDTCYSCSYLKAQEISLRDNGQKSPAWTSEIREKRINTNLERYGSETPLSNKEVRAKIEETNLGRYGVKHVASSPEIRRQMTETNIQRYGVENPFQSEVVKEKMRATNLERYGFEYITQNKDEMDKRSVKMLETRYRNGNTPSSRQQEYLHGILGGELNYPVDRLNLDIAFPENKIYLEYQGSGHDLSVQMNKITQGEFDKKEINRYYFLKSKGWKMIEIISNFDNLPDEAGVVDLYKRALLALKESSYIVFDLDKKEIKQDGRYIPYDIELPVNGYYLKKWEMEAN